MNYIKTYVKNVIHGNHLEHIIAKDVINVFLEWIIIVNGLIIVLVHLIINTFFYFLYMF